jgi:peptide methionine sulfoxide reductase MsrA
MPSQVEYDPAQVRYEQLLDVFSANHDPIQLNRQRRMSAPGTAR